MATLYLGLRLKSRTQERVTLDNVDLNDTVDSVRQKAAAQSNTTPEKIGEEHLCVCSGACVCVCGHRAGPLFLAFLYEETQSEGGT